MDYRLDTITTDTVELEISSVSASTDRASQFANKFLKLLCHFLSRVLTITAFP